MTLTSFNTFLISQGKSRVNGEHSVLLLLKEPYVLFMTLTSITSYVVSRNDSKNGLRKAHSRSSTVHYIVVAIAVASSWKRYEAERKSKQRGERGQARLYFDIVASKSLWCVNLLKASGIDRDNFTAGGTTAACPSKHCKVLSCYSGWLLLLLLLLVMKTKFTLESSIVSCLRSFSEAHLRIFSWYLYLPPKQYSTFYSRSLITVKSIIRILPLPGLY